MVRVSFSRCEMTTFDEPDGVQGWESDSRRINILENVLGPKCEKSGLFSKARVSGRVRLRVRVSFSRCEMTTFDEPDGVQGWESDSRRIFGKRFWAQSVQKVDFFSKARVSVRVRLRVRVSFSRSEMTTFDEPDGVQGWESDSRRIFGKGFEPKVCKKWTFFQKLGLALGLGLGLGLAFQGVK